MTHSYEISHEHGASQGPDHGQDWEEIYTGEQVWSGNPNVALVNAFSGPLADLTPGRAAEIGCGEGADAVWLAQRGWKVTAIDPAQGAIERGASAESAVGQEIAHPITWVRGGLLDVSQDDLPAGGFDLVTVFYPALTHTGDADVEERLAGMLASGGTLLLVGHLRMDEERAREHGFDLNTLVSVPDMADYLEAHGFLVERSIAERDVTEGAGAHHHEDIIVIARKK